MTQTNITEIVQAGSLNRQDAVAVGGLARARPDEDDDFDNSDVGGDGAQEPVRPIRALLRGLDALKALNERDGLTVTQVADKARLPRTTAYRILETLRHGGFVIRDDMDDRYRPTQRVRGLADGAASEAWIHDGAWPALSRLGKTLLWPLGLWTVENGAVTLRAATDKSSPLALNRLTIGSTADPVRSAAGLAILAFSGKDQQDAALAALPSQGATQALSDRLGDARRNGYAFDQQAIGGEMTLAVPVRREGAVTGAVTIRFIRSALNDTRVLSELLPQLLTLRDEIEARPVA